MLKILFALCLFALPSGCTHGAKTDLSSIPAEGGEPYFWTVRKDGRLHYLLGTIHAGFDAERELGSEVWQALGAADCFVMESDQQNVEARELLAMARLPEGERLPDMVGKEVWDRVTARLGTRMPLDLLAQSRPWFVTMLYLQSLTPPGEPMDLTLMRHAQRARKRIVFLEDWREALQSFATVTDAADLRELTLNEDEARTEMRLLVEAYRGGHVAELERVTRTLNAGMVNGVAKLDVLLVGRNKRWMPHLLRHLQSGSCFVAVGAAHLVGEDNLRTLLEREGFKVERLRKTRVGDAI